MTIIINLLQIFFPKRVQNKQYHISSLVLTSQNSKRQKERKKIVNISSKRNPH